MSEKKQKEKKGRSVYKILAVVGCVLFVVLMIVSSMGTGWITSFKSVKPGDAVTIDLTIRDASGNAIVTSDEQLYRGLVAEKKTPYYSKQLVMVANQSSTESLIPIPIYSVSEGWANTFALFGGEHDAISQALVGMKTNEQKTVTIPFTDSMTQSWSTPQLEGQGVNMTDVHVGTILALGVSQESVLAKNASESSYSIRLGEVTRKTAENVILDFGYPKIEIKVVAIGTG